MSGFYGIGSPELSQPRQDASASRLTKLHKSRPQEVVRRLRFSDMSPSSWLPKPHFSQANGVAVVDVDARTQGLTVADRLRQYVSLGMRPERSRSVSAKLPGARLPVRPLVTTSRWDFSPHRFRPAPTHTHRAARRSSITLRSVGAALFAVSTTRAVICSSESSSLCTGQARSRVLTVFTSDARGCHICSRTGLAPATFA
jgi:hypothetical protein